MLLPTAPTSTAPTSTSDMMEVVESLMVQDNEHVNWTNTPFLTEQPIAEHTTEQTQPTEQQQTIESVDPMNSYNGHQSNLVKSQYSAHKIIKDLIDLLKSNNFETNAIINSISFKFSKFKIDHKTKNEFLVDFGADSWNCLVLDNSTNNSLPTKPQIIASQLSLLLSEKIMKRDEFIPIILGNSPTKFVSAFFCKQQNILDIETKSVKYVTIDLLKMFPNFGNTKQKDETFELIKKEMGSFIWALRLIENKDHFIIPPDNVEFDSVGGGIKLIKFDTSDTIKSLRNETNVKLPKTIDDALVVLSYFDYLEKSPIFMNFPSIKSHHFVKFAHLSDTNDLNDSNSNSNVSFQKMIKCNMEESVGIQFELYDRTELFSDPGLSLYDLRNFLIKFKEIVNGGKKFLFVGNRGLNFYYDKNIGSIYYVLTKIDYSSNIDLDDLLIQSDLTESFSYLEKDGIKKNSPLLSKVILKPVEFFVGKYSELPRHFSCSTQFQQEQMRQHPSIFLKKDDGFLKLYQHKFSYLWQISEWLKTLNQFDPDYQLPISRKFKFEYGSNSQSQFANFDDKFNFKNHGHFGLISLETSSVERITVSDFITFLNVLLPIKDYYLICDRHPFELTTTNGETKLLKIHLSADSSLLEWNVHYRNVLGGDKIVINILPPSERLDKLLSPYVEFNGKLNFIFDENKEEFKHQNQLFFQNNRSYFKVLYQSKSICVYEKLETEIVTVQGKSFEIAKNHVVPHNFCFTVETLIQFLASYTKVYLSSDSITKIKGSMIKNSNQNYQITNDDYEYSMISLQYANPPQSATKLAEELKKYHAFAPVLFQNEPFSLKEEVMKNGVCLFPLVSKTPSLELSTAHPLSKFIIEPFSYREFVLDDRAIKHQLEEILPELANIVKKPIRYGLIDTRLEFVVVKGQKTMLICPLFEFKRLCSLHLDTMGMGNLIQFFDTQDVTFSREGIEFRFNFLPKQLGITNKIFPLKISIYF